MEGRRKQQQQPQQQIKTPPQQAKQSQPTSHLRLTISRTVWETIAKEVSANLKGADADAVRQKVILTIPLCIGFKSKVKQNAEPRSKEAEEVARKQALEEAAKNFEAIIDDCDFRGYPYKIVLYKNPRDKKAVDAWLEACAVALVKAGKNVIDAEDIRSTSEWRDASATYDNYFNQTGVGEQAKLDAVTKHRDFLLRDAAKFVSRTNPDCDQKVITDLVDKKIRLEDAPEPIRTLVTEAREYIILEIKDCMVRMMRKIGQQPAASDNAQVPTLKMNFLLYEGNLYDSISHVISLAGEMGYHERSIHYAKYKITSQPVELTNSAAETEAYDESLEHDQNSEFVQFVNETKPALGVLSETVVDAIIRRNPNAAPAEIAQAVATSFTEVFKNLRRTDPVPVPANYASNTSTMFGGNARRHSPPQNRQLHAAQNGNVTDSATKHSPGRTTH